MSDKEHSKEYWMEFTDSWAGSLIIYTDPVKPRALLCGASPILNTHTAHTTDVNADSRFQKNIRCT